MRALAERLDVVLAGATLTRCDLLSFSGLKTVTPAPDDLVGRTVSAVTSTGKYLVLVFDGPRVLVHLGNAGRLDVEHPPKATRPRGSLARLTFSSCALLVREHGTERRAGLWVLGEGDDGPLAELGPDPFSDEFERFLLVTTDTRHVHSLLGDQRTVRGIGRGYADDILHEAQLSPFATVGTMDAPTRARLLDAIRRVMTDALTGERERTGGLSDASLGDRFRVHRRAGEPCPRCGRTLERVSYATHEVVYCPTCQTKGKVLADRRMSRLVK